MSDLQFIQNVRMADITVSFTSDDQVIVMTKLTTEFTHYACYVYINDHLVERRDYQTKNQFEIDISQYSLHDDIKVRFYFMNKALNQRMAKTVDLTQYRLRHFVLRSGLKLLLNDKLINAGRSIVEKNVLKLGSFPDYHMESQFDFWEENPFNNRSWQWRLHWFEFLNNLLAYHNDSKDIRALDIAKISIESWWDSYWDKESDFEFIWHDHATALRAEVLLVFANYVEEYNPQWFTANKNFIDRLYIFLEVLKIKLSDKNFYSEHTNHGLEQARVLLLLSIYFQDIDSQKLAIQRISSELDFSFTEEGVHKENSPGYHQFVLKVFLGIISDFPKSILGELSEKFDKIGTKALEFLAHIIRPDGHLPIIGDTELIRPSDSYAQYFSEDIEYQEYLYSMTKGRKGIKPKDRYKVYEKSGYAIYRNKWGSRIDFDQTFQLILKAGCLSQYHHQQDEGSIVLYAFGEDWLVDSGLFNYINNDPIRKYMRGRFAHNVPMVIGRPYYEKFTHRTSSWQLEHFDNANTLLVKASNSVLKGTIFSRTFKVAHNQINNNFSFIIQDEVIIDENEDIEFYWHIPNDKDVTIQDNAVFIRSRLSDSILKIVFSIIPDNFMIEKGVVENKVMSCISTKFGECTDSILVKVRYKNRSKIKLITSFLYIV